MNLQILYTGLITMYAAPLTMKALGACAVLAIFFSPMMIAAPVEDKVLMPGGYRARANFQAVPTGGRIAHVGGKIHLFDETGTVVHVASPLPAASASKPVTALLPEETGWVTYASWMNTADSPIATFTTTWTVPDVPATQNDQTIFLFNSIEPASFDGIMQPVLQYGPSAAGGGAFWAAATWYLVGDQTYFTPLVPVEVGQTLNGLIELVGTNGSTFNYRAEFTNIPKTALQIDGGEELAWATETLEAYAVTGPSDYPAGSTVFSGINLELVGGETPAVTWDVVNDETDGLSTTIDVDGPTDAQLTIQY
ncbi:hypothetical protein FB451DRAFT_1396133 [Mycena latifolia]|nr:hypothetical protein FB451DRAFT_1396133 [Mycena latifolia]